MAATAPNAVRPVVFVHGIVAIAASIWGSLLTQTTPNGEQRLFRFLFFREMPAGMNVYYAKLYIRTDLLPLYNDIRYGEG
jgi:hypothetical protein